ncbi:MAG TPA: DUF4058 family protein [Armatimonadota bacterium]|nr:DUF4058 family protein [Armatimonadota bacterium]
MPSPFPGMDPYLEHPSRWPNVHYSLISALRDTLQPLLRPRYWVAMEERVYVADSPSALGRPDAAVVDRGGAPARGGGLLAPARSVEVYVPTPETVHEPYLEVRELTAGAQVVTVIEVLSPANKNAGAGRDAYLEKRGVVLGSQAHLVEIDLLRAGRRMPSLGAPTEYDYGVLLCRSHTRPRAELCPFTVREPAPAVPLPLQAAGEEVPIPLGELLHAIYDRGGFDLVIDYRQPPEPPLSDDDEAWADTLLREQGLR